MEFTTALRATTSPAEKWLLSNACSPLTPTGPTELEVGKVPAAPCALRHWLGEALSVVLMNPTMFPGFSVVSDTELPLPCPEVLFTINLTEITSPTLKGLEKTSCAAGLLMLLLLLLLVAAVVLLVLLNLC
jgi:hypothetical protein